MLDVPGASDWSLYFGQHNVAQMVTSAETWRFDCKRDAALQERLQNSAIATEIEQSNTRTRVRGYYPTVIYRASQKTLAYREDVSPDQVPTPERFREQLELVLRLAQINEQINRAQG